MVRVRDDGIEYFYGIERYRCYKFVRANERFGKQNCENLMNILDRIIWV